MKNRAFSNISCILSGYFRKNLRSNTQSLTGGEAMGARTGAVGTGLSPVPTAPVRRNGKGLFQIETGQEQALPFGDATC